VEAAGAALRYHNEPRDLPFFKHESNFQSMNKLIVLIIGIVSVLLISGCVQQVTRYVCPDGSAVDDSALCKKQYICENGGIVEQKELCPQCECEKCPGFWYFISGGQRQELVDLGQLNYTTNMISGDTSERECAEEMLRRHPELTELDVFCKLYSVKPTIDGVREGKWQEFYWSVSCMCFIVTD
jgi:hypothetical protein